MDEPPSQLHPHVLQLRPQPASLIKQLDQLPRAEQILKMLSRALRLRIAASQRQPVVLDNNPCKRYRRCHTGSACTLNSFFNAVDLILEPAINLGQTPYMVRLLMFAHARIVKQPAQIHVNI